MTSAKNPTNFSGGSIKSPGKSKSVRIPAYGGK